MKEERKTQKKMLLNHLRLFGSIEPLTALREYGIYRLGARIADLRNDGHSIVTERTTSISSITGNPVTFAKYIYREPHAEGATTAATTHGNNPSRF